MARIETDPNYTSPTFSRATAATDLFKKEDVQNLAAAVSTHVHDGTHGLVLNVAGSIPGASLAVGSVTSAQILDGTILGGDIAPNAIGTPHLADGTVTTPKIAGSQVTAVIFDVPITSSFSTTVTNTWIDTNVKGTGVYGVSGVVPSLLLYTVSVQHSVSNAIYSLGFGLDGAIQQSQGFSTGGATAGFPRIVTIFGWVSGLTGSHTLSVMVNTATAGTLSFRSESVCHILSMEFKR